MELLRTIFGPIGYVLSKQKKMILLTFVAFVAFAILTFPYDDLSDPVTAFVAKSSGGQVFVQFKKMGLSFFPPSLELTDVAVDTPGLPTIKAGEAYVAPNILGLIQFKPGFNATVDDFLKGRVKVDFRLGRLAHLDVGMQKINLKSLSTFAQLPFDLDGRLQGRFTADLDAGFIVPDPKKPDLTQPEGDIAFHVDKLFFSGLSVPTQMGPLPIDDTTLGLVDLKGTMKDGQLEITEATVGQAGDVIHGKIKLSMALKFAMMGNKAVPTIGRYEVKLDLVHNPAEKGSYKTFLGFFDTYKRVEADGEHYALKLTGQDAYSPPVPGPLGTF